MRLALAQFGQETTDTFNPAPTTLDDFRAFGLYVGDDLVDKMRGVSTIGGYLDVVASWPDVEMAELAWSMRDEFQVKESVSADEAVLRAVAAHDGVVVISDTSDSMFGGSAGDSTVVLESVLRIGGGVSALIPMVDRGAVARLTAAGEGTTVTVEVGGVPLRSLLRWR